MIRILVADDHAIVREGLKQILADIPHMVVAGEAADGQEVLEQVRDGEWDLILLDIAMPGRGRYRYPEAIEGRKTEAPRSCAQHVP